MSFIRSGMGSALMAMAMLSTALGQAVNVKEDVPAMIQLDFGPYGSRLPGDGNAYCYPTSASMLLFWLNQNGYSQIADPFSDQAALDLDRVIGGLMQTSATGGTTVVNYQAGLNDYLSAKGIASNLIEWTISYQPTLEWFNDHNGPNSVVLAGLSWYYREGDTDNFGYAGGHGTALISADPTASTLTVNNPYPSTFFNIQNIPANGQLTVDVIPVPNDWDLEYDSGGPYIQILTPIIGPGNVGNQNTFAVYDTGVALWLDDAAKPGDPGYSLAEWTLNSSKQLNTNGGFFSVLAPLVGTGGLLKTGDGELQLQNTNSLSGPNQLAGGTLSSTSSSTTPFGTGSMTITSGTLAFKPDETGDDDLFQTLASGSGNQLEINGDAHLSLDRGTHSSLTVTVGGNDSGMVPNFLFSNHGTLTVSVASGLNELGSSVKLLAAGSAGNQPAVLNGMILPSAVGAHAASPHSATFLTYDSTNGFMTATLTGGDLNAATTTTVYQATSDQVLTADQSVYAMVIENATTVSGAYDLALGSGGLILNGANLQTTSLTYGASDAYVYTNLDGGVISSALTGSGTLVKFGPGTLTLDGNSSATQTGDIQINAGTLLVAASGATGGGTLEANQGTTLRVAGTVAGSVILGSQASAHLDGGTIQGGIDVSEYATLRGSGTIEGASEINGSILAGDLAPGILNFEHNVTFGEYSQFYWTLNALVDDANGGIIGTNWNALTFDQSTDFGGTLYMDINSAWDPNSGNPFWNEDRRWTFALTIGTFNFEDADIETWSWLSGSFSLHSEVADSTLVLKFTANPAPVPEPSSAALIVLGLALAAWHRNRQSRS